MSRGDVVKSTADEFDPSALFILNLGYNMNCHYITSGSRGGAHPAFKAFKHLYKERIIYNQNTNPIV